MAKYCIKINCGTGTPDHYASFQGRLYVGGEDEARASIEQANKALQDREKYARGILLQELFSAANVQQQSKYKKKGEKSRLDIPKEAKPTIRAINNFTGDNYDKLARQLQKVVNKQRAAAMLANFHRNRQRPATNPLFLEVEPVDPQKHYLIKNGDNFQKVSAMNEATQQQIANGLASINNGLNTLETSIEAAPEGVVPQVVIDKVADGRENYNEMMQLFTEFSANPPG